MASPTIQTRDGDHVAFVVISRWADEMGRERIQKGERYCRSYEEAVEYAKGGRKGVTRTIEIVRTNFEQPGEIVRVPEDFLELRLRFERTGSIFRKVAA